MGKASVSSVHVCYVIAAREDGTTALLSMSWEAFEHSLGTIVREGQSQYPL